MKHDFSELQAAPGKEACFKSKISMHALKLMFRGHYRFVWHSVSYIQPNCSLNRLH